MTFQRSLTLVGGPHVPHLQSQDRRPAVKCNQQTVTDTHTHTPTPAITGQETSSEMQPANCYRHTHTLPPLQSQDRGPAVKCNQQIVTDTHTLPHLQSQDRGPAVKCNQQIVTDAHTHDDPCIVTVHCGEV